MMERGEVDDATGCESILKVILVISLAQTRGRSRAARQHLSSGRWTIEPTKDMPGKSTLRRTISISIAPIRYHPFGVPSDPNKMAPGLPLTDLTHRCIPFNPSEARSGPGARARKYPRPFPTRDSRPECAGRKWLRGVF